MEKQWVVRVIAPDGTEHNIRSREEWRELKARYDRTQPSVVIEGHQTCPKCNGQKHVATPPWVAGDVRTYTTSDTRLYPCPLCAGSGIIPTIGIQTNGT